MDSAVFFRDFEERDIDFVYKCKNNEKVWEYTVGDFHMFSYEEAVEWVHGCMRDDPTYKFWAICKNDETRDIVGWCSIANIDYENKSAEGYGIVIADFDYNDGITCIECVLYILDYVFNFLNFDIFYTSWFAENPYSKYLFCLAEYKNVESYIEFKNGHLYNVVTVSLSKDVYLRDKENGSFELKCIAKRIRDYYLSKNQSNLDY